MGRLSLIPPITFDYFANGISRVFLMLVMTTGITATTIQGEIGKSIITENSQGRREN